MLCLIVRKEPAMMARFLDRISSKPMKGLLCTALALTLCTAFAPTVPEAHAATASTLKQSAPAASLASGGAESPDAFTVITNGSNLTVSLRHKEAFTKSILRVFQDGKKGFKDTPYNTVGNGKSQTCTLTYDCSKLSTGTYRARLIAYKPTMGKTLYSSYTTYIQGVKFTVANGQPTIHTYNSILKQNASLTAKKSPAKYKNKSLKDYKYQLFRKAGKWTGKPRAISAKKESALYKKVANKAVKGATTPYQKAVKLYEYVAKNFYYDFYGVAKGKPGYDDPYNNLLNLTKKKSNGYNSVKGKVAVQCDGYAGIYVALARSQNIPARIVYGRKITAGSASWEKLAAKNFKKSSHTWAQIYLDGRWINVDPQQGSYNSRGKGGSKTNKKFVKAPMLNYTFFDVSPEQFANSHLVIKIL